MTGKKSISRVAGLHGKSEAHIRREIRRCMDIAMKNPDPKVRAIWASIPKKGKEPTVEEFIEWAAMRARMRLDVHLS